MRILIRALAGRAIGQSKQKDLKLLLKTTEAFSFTMIQGREGWLKVKNFPGYYRSLALLSILYLSHLSSNQVPDSFTFAYLSFHPYILRWLKKKNSLQKQESTKWLKHESLNVLRKSTFFLWWKFIHPNVEISGGFLTTVC